MVFLQMIKLVKSINLKNPVIHVQEVKCVYKHHEKVYMIYFTYWGECIQDIHFQTQENSETIYIQHIHIYFSSFIIPSCKTQQRQKFFSLYKYLTGTGYHKQSLVQRFQSEPVPGTFTHLRSCIVQAEITEPPKNNL